MCVPATTATDPAAPVVELSAVMQELLLSDDSGLLSIAWAQANLDAITGAVSGVTLLPLEDVLVEVVDDPFSTSAIIIRLLLLHIDQAVFQPGDPALEVFVSALVDELVARGAEVPAALPSATASTGISQLFEALEVPLAALPAPTTTASSSSVPEEKCLDAPLVPFGVDHSHCVGLASGATCEAICQDGTTWPPAAGPIECSSGNWEVPAACIYDIATLGATSEPIATYITSAVLWVILVDVQGLGFTSVDDALHFVANVASMALVAPRAQILAEVGPSLGRRLQQGAGLVQLRLWLLDLPLSALDDQVQLATSFFASLLEELRALGLNEPSAGWPVMLQLETPVFIEAMTVAEPLWVVVTDWSSCDESCGSGTRARDVRCATVDPVVCELGASDLPASVESCEDFSDCGFCPFGGEACILQLVLFIGLLAVILILVCCCAFFAWHVHRTLQPPTKGARTIHLRDEDGAPLREPSGPATPASEAGGGQQVAVLDTITATFQVIQPENPEDGSGDGKVHVKWDYDEQQVEQWFEHERNLSLQKAAGQQLRPLQEDEFDDLVEEQPLCLLASTHTGARHSAGPMGLLELGGGLTAPPAYRSGTLAEYFSNTHQSWTPCRVEVVMGEAAASGDNAGAAHHTVQYNAVVWGRQILDVHLDSLRPLFRVGELVEVFYWEEAAWLPARVSRAGYLHTSVDIEACSLCPMGEYLDRVAHQRLRRRYPAGSRVLVYRGQGLVPGWCEARVHETAGDGCNLRSLFAQPAEHPRPGGVGGGGQHRLHGRRRWLPDTPGRSMWSRGYNIRRNAVDRSTSRSTLGDDDTRIPITHGLWTSVPIVAASLGSAARPDSVRPASAPKDRESMVEFVPSFLVSRIQKSPFSREARAAASREPDLPELMSYVQPATPPDTEIVPVLRPTTPPLGNQASQLRAVAASNGGKTHSGHARPAGGGGSRSAAIRHL